MFLLQIYNNKIKQQSLITISSIQTFINKIKQQKQQKQVLLASIKTNTNRILNKLNIIKYILGISLYKTNAIIYFSDTKGHIKFFCSAGQLDLSKKARKKTLLVVIKLIKFMLVKFKYINKNERIALHLKNINQHTSYIILKIISKQYKVEVVKVQNNQPHNGCRPRKLKRKKKQKLNFHLNKDKELMKE